MASSRMQHSSSLKLLNPMDVLQPFCRERKLSSFIPSRPGGPRKTV